MIKHLRWQSNPQLLFCFLLFFGGLRCSSDDASQLILRVGASELVITPDLGETYLDYNGNNRWDEDEPYDDTNGNGAFDPLWIANDIRRPALSIQDDLYVNAVVFEYGDQRIGMVGIDSFGHSFTELERIRQHPDFAGLGLDLVIMGSSHTHEGPDTVGIYGPSAAESGVDEAYMAFIREQVLEALVNSVASLQPATMESATLNTGLDTYQVDQRDPIIIDDQLAVIRFRSVSHNRVLATLINWASHPEQVIDGTSISSDYVGAWREAQKELHPDGVPVFFQGAMGGQIGSNNIAFTYQDSTFEACGMCSYEKAHALGEILSGLTEQALATGVQVAQPDIEHRSTEVMLPLEHPGFQALFNAGTIDRDLFDASGTPIEGQIVPGETSTYLKSEMVFVRLGDVSMLSVPGELHPELAIGGYDGSATPGGIDAIWSADNTGIEDLAQAPPPPYLRDLLDTRVRMILGVTQDFTGYILPAFNFDLHPTTPYLDSHDWNHHYEETNALSPNMAKVVHQAARELTGK